MFDIYEERRKGTSIMCVATNQGNSLACLAKKRFFFSFFLCVCVLSLALFFRCLVYAVTIIYLYVCVSVCVIDMKVCEDPVDRSRSAPHRVWMNMKN